MSATLTPEKREEIRKRAEAATPGPWAYESVSEKSNDYCVGIVCPVDKDGDPGDPITGNVKHHPHHFNAETGDFGEWYYEMVCSIDEDEHGGDGSPHGDARFIAHAREDIPALLSALDAAIERAEKAEAANMARPDYPVFCSDCGRAHVLDTVLPSDIWNQIASPNDLLCVVCIDARLKAAGLHVEAQFYYSGLALKSELYALHLADERDALCARVAELEAALLAARPHIREQYAAAHIPPPRSEAVRNIRIKVLGEVSDKIDAALKENISKEEQSS